MANGVFNDRTFSRKTSIDVNIFVEDFIYTVEFQE